MTRTIESELLSRATLFTITLRSWGNRAKADISKTDMRGSDEEQFNLTKKLVDSKEYDEITSYLRKCKSWYLARSMASFVKSGVFMVKLDMVEEFERKLAEDLAYLRDVLVPNFLAAYPAEIEKARVALDGQFNADDYPGEGYLKNAFGIEWGWISFGVPDNIPPELRERELSKLRDKLVEAEAEIRAALRSSFAELVERMTDRLKGDSVRTTGLVKNFEEFFDTFRAKNLMEDRKLEEMVSRSKEILSRVTPRALGTRVSVREATAKAFDEVKKQVDLLVKEAPTRKFREE